MKMRVLVVHASRYGATQGIAERIATTLRQRGLDTTVEPILADRPVWLFSSGPLGTEAKDAQGRDLRVVTEPKEIAVFREVIHPRDHRVFFGALDRNKLGFTHGLLLKMFAGGDKGLPEGDFRDWNEIEAWVCNIAQALISADRAALSQVHDPAALVNQ
jgi:menaquinone-dependent protoporphyrinogen oxidase